MKAEQQDLAELANYLLERQEGKAVDPAIAAVATQILEGQNVERQKAAQKAVRQLEISRRFPWLSPQAQAALVEDPALAEAMADKSTDPFGPFLQSIKAGAKRT